MSPQTKKKSARKSCSRSERIENRARRPRRLARGFAGVVLLLCALGGEVRASPWALPSGRLAVTGSVDYSFATREFLDARRARPFPLEGFFQSTTFNLGSRYGLGRGWDLEVNIPVKVVSYASEPVILLPPAPDVPVFDGFQENVIDPSRTEAGIANIEAAVRKQWLRGPAVFSTQLVAKIPAGYQGPAGTFGESPTTQEEFLENPARFVRPENVRDDVTLGDGQVDLTAWLHGGASTSEGLFLRAAIGYRLRLDGAADQVVTVSETKCDCLVTHVSIPDPGAAFSCKASRRSRRLAASLACGVTGLRRHWLAASPPYPCHGQKHEARSPRNHIAGVGRRTDARALTTIVG